MRCFKCHDHKFDPLPTKDYYRFYSVFSHTQLAERPAPFLEEENLEGLKSGKEKYPANARFCKGKIPKAYNKQEDAAKEWFAQHGKEYLDENKRRSLPDEENLPDMLAFLQVKLEDSKFAGKMTGFGPDDSSVTNHWHKVSIMDLCLKV